MSVGRTLRALARMPVVSSVVVISLATGIGANTTIYSWIRAVVYAPMPAVSDSGAFHFIEPVTASGAYPSVSWADYEDYAERIATFRSLAAFRMAPFYVGDSGRTERAYGEFVSGNFFDVLGLRPSLGRLLVPADTAHPGGGDVLVVSADYWRSHLNSDPSAVGRVLRVNDRQMTVVGVAPPGFQGSILGLAFDFWVPATMAPSLMPGSNELTDRDVRAYAVMGRLRADVTRADAERDAERVRAQLAAEYPSQAEPTTARVLRYFDAPRGPQRFFASALWFLQGLMALLLAAVCSNAANLMLARASTRARDAGVRLALGAGRRRIVGMILGENLLLAAVGAGVGALAAVWGTEMLRAVPMTAAFPIHFQTQVDISSLVFTAALGVVCGVAAGAPAAWQLSRMAPLDALREGARGGNRSALRSSLMGVQAALAMVLIATAALFYRSFRESQDTNPGFRTDGVLLAAYDLTGRSEVPLVFARTLLERLRAMPSIESAAIAAAVPLDIHGLPQRTFAVEGRARTDGTQDACDVNVVTPGYFTLLDVPFVAGRDFRPLEDVSTAREVIVNQAFVDRYLTGLPPLGRDVQLRGRPFAIVGVVATTVADAFGEPPAPVVYLSYREGSANIGEIHLRGRPGADAALTAAAYEAVRAIDPELPLYNIRTMSEHIDRNLVLRRIPARLFTVLGPMLLGLAGIGVYAVVSYSAAQRTREIAIRLAIGAPPPRVARTVMWDGLRPVVIGGAFGWALVVLVDLHLFRGGAADLAVLAGVPVLLFAAAAAAAWLPARRAATASIARMSACL